MEDKQKVTLYLPPQLHRQLKIRSAVDADSMSNIVERAVEFYLNHSDVVDGVESHGLTHQVYNCPECEHPVVIRDGAMVALGQQSGLLAENLFSSEEALSIVQTRRSSARQTSRLTHSVGEPMSRFSTKTRLSALSTGEKRLSPFVS